MGWTDCDETVPWSKNSDSTPENKQIINKMEIINLAKFTPQRAYKYGLMIVQT